MVSHHRARSHVGFDSIFDTLAYSLLATGDRVETHWQATRGVPQNKTVELANVTAMWEMVSDKQPAQVLIKPTLPWAEDHFQERVSRVPHNPPPSAAYWAKKGVDEHRGADGKFSHSYPERFWPRFADRGNELGEYMGNEQHHGIRYPYGDLDDVVSLLAREPFTRQAFLPVWFPEDTGAVHRERVPCTLGYHFMLREGKLHTWYFMRSCDLLRHFRNDVYLATRLTQWVIEEIQDRFVDVTESGAGWSSVWRDVTPGTLTMHISSLHVFEPDLPVLRHLLP